MMWINRTLSEELVYSARIRPAIVLTGARQTGKSSLVRRVFPGAHYVTLDHVAEAEFARADPRGFLSKHAADQVIIDEVQYAPMLLREIKALIDADRQRNGRWIVTGSQRFDLMDGVQESLAGRARILDLGTLSAAELRNSGLFSPAAIANLPWRGGYPEIWAAHDVPPAVFFEDYIATYLNRDLRHIVAVRDAGLVYRFMTACALRAGSLLSYDSLARQVQISATTARTWIGALEQSGVIFLLPAFSANIGKRLSKSPKLYFSDSGLLSHFLRVTDAQLWEQSTHRGPIWENTVARELVASGAAVPGQDLFYYRDQNAVEVDFVIDRVGSPPTLIEAKAHVGERSIGTLSRVGNLLGTPPEQRVVATMEPDLDLEARRGHLLWNPLRGNWQFN